MSSKKRTLHSFFQSTSPTKRAKVVHESDDRAHAEEEEASQPLEIPSFHPTYPFPVTHLPSSILDGLGFVPSAEPRVINDQPDLDLLYYAPYIPAHIHRKLFEFLRSQLFFYRVRYNIKRGTVETEINTPRYTTVFGVDETSYFASSSACEQDSSSSTSPMTTHKLHEKSTSKPVAKDKYKCSPRPLPHCLDKLREITEAATGEMFNFCLVNYYASGNDSISYHSDDERFLGTDPCIASLSLGAKRDFLLRHKPLTPGETAGHQNESADDYKKAVERAASTPLKFALASGDMVLMRGKTQGKWLHSIPKRKGPGSEGGRINITFRKALVKAGTENYYTYNVGNGRPFKWNPDAGEMKLWNPS